MPRVPIPQRNLSAEVRAVEAGHHARLAPDHRSFLVSSDTRPGVTYTVVPVGVGGLVRSVCDCPAGRSRGAATGLGSVPCMHCSVVLRRMEREGLVRFDGLWHVTELAEELAGIHLAEVIDHEHGARSNFEVRCSCGYTCAVASLRREAAQEHADRHMAAFLPETCADVFRRLG